METSFSQDTKQQQTYWLEFFGKGSEYFSIMIVNWLLTLVTLGLYYPWARAKRLQYIYRHTALNNERFHFSGTGNEMFRGFIKLFVLYAAFMVAFVLYFYVGYSSIYPLLLLYFAVFALIPFAIHGSFRYRMSRTSYRGIRFGYRGNRNELAINYYKWVFFSIITFGIYGAWLSMNTRRYTHQHIRYGDVQFYNLANGADFLLIILKGYFLTIFTLGIYYFWWQCEFFNYYIDRMRMTKGDQKIKCYSSATGVDFLGLLVVNFLIILFTLGFGKAWADMRTQKFMCDHVKMEGDIDIDAIYQTEEEYTDAFGEDALDFFEIDMA
jgi:uncharacterized membrane protein YjgN (DUF898 family)